MENEEIKEQIGKDLDKLIIRNYIKNVFPKYDENEIYIIYNGKEVEIYKKEMLGLRKSLGQIDSYLISYPIRIL